MNDNKERNARTDQDNQAAPTLSGDPDRSLELKLKRNPQDPNSKTDVGSDESMDASDPISATQPGSGESGTFFRIS